MSQKASSPNESWKGISVNRTSWRPNYQLQKTIPLRYDEKGMLSILFITNGIFKPFFFFIKDNSCTKDNALFRGGLYKHKIYNA